MKADVFEQVDMPSLRIGMYVELGMGWLSHPFPTGSFKISSAKQIEIIRGLGLAHVRVNVTKSDPAPEPSLGGVTPVAASRPDIHSASEEQAVAAQREQLLRRQRAEQLAAEHHSLAQCEKRFGEAVRQYRKTLEQLPTQPKAAA